MKDKRYCYHITNGTSRSPLVAGTVTAQTMEEAAMIAARRAKLVIRFNNDDQPGLPMRYFTTEGGDFRNVYVLCNP